jgi:NAD+ kinase
LKVGIFTNLNKDEGLSVTNKLVECLKARSVAYVFDESLRGKIDGEFFSLSKKNEIDFMITIGGDGTILRIAKRCALNEVPIVGLNLGYTGFLAEEEPSEIDELVSALTSGKYDLDCRTIISVQKDEETFYALNDAVINREYDARMLEADVFVNSEFVDSYFCDGYIVSTPTGSTAYSFSAGGGILSPSVEAFILTSINSHSLHSRPIVVSENDEITVTASKRSFANLIVDGAVVASVKGGDSIVVKKADFKAKFVRLRGKSFYKNLLTKLNKWSVTEKEND